MIQKYNTRPSFISCLILFSLLPVISFGNSGIGCLSAETRKPGLSPGHYFIRDFIDNRSDTALGKVLQDLSGKKGELRLCSGSTGFFMKLIGNIIENDTTLLPLVFRLDECRFTDSGPVRNHIVRLQFKASIIRSFGKDSLKLFESSGTPSIQARGILQDAWMNLLSASITSFITSFSKWVNENPGQPALCRQLIVENRVSDSNADTKDTLRWKPGLLLHWDDFRGKPAASPFSAQSNCIFTYTADPSYDRGIMKVKVYLNACFAKNSSWVKPDDKKASLLLHEQLHFDICELYIRHLRKKVQQASFSIPHLNEEMKELFDSSWAEYQERQNAYDLETGHGTNELIQEKWNKAITDELNSYAEYSSSENKE